MSKWLRNMSPAWGAFFFVVLVMPLDFWFWARFPWWSEYWCATAFGFMAWWIGLWATIHIQNFLRSKA